MVKKFDNEMMNGSAFAFALEVTDRTKRTSDNPDPEYKIVARSNEGKDKVSLSAAATVLLGLGNRENLEVVSNKDAILNALKTPEGTAKVAEYCEANGKDLQAWLDSDKTDVKNCPFSFFLFKGRPLFDETGKAVTVRDTRISKKAIAALCTKYGVETKEELPLDAYESVQATEGFRMTISGVKNGAVGYDLDGNDSRNWGTLGGNRDNHVIYSVGAGIPTKLDADSDVETMIYPISYSRISEKIEKNVKSE